MKLGFSLYRHMLNEQHYKFAKQFGASHVVVHLVDYFGHTRSQSEKFNQPLGDDRGWGFAGDEQLWQIEDLLNFKAEFSAQGLEWVTIENFDPSMWYDVLLDGPQKKVQIKSLKEQIRIVGKAGIPIFGYNFSLTGVASRISGPFARGRVTSVGMDSCDESLIPNGMFWNMIYNTDASEGFLPVISHDELWNRLQFFLDELMTVAEEAGVRLAAHPDDPPMPVVRQTPRLFY